MATYKSDKVDVISSAENLFRKVSNPENLLNVISSLPEEHITPEQKAQLSAISVTPDSIVLPGGPVGSLTLRIVERKEPTLIRLQGEGTPVAMEVKFNITPISQDLCQAQAVLDLDIPMMLKPMINGPMQKMVNQFSILLRQLGSMPAAE